MTNADESAAKAEHGAAKLFSFTIDANTAQIVKLESLDATGNRHELSEEEKASLVKEARDDRLEKVVEQAFEAGIACVLDSEVEQDDAQDSADDAELRHILLTPLIERSPARRLMEREVLNRAILDTLIEHSMKARESVLGDRPTARAQ